MMRTKLEQTVRCLVIAAVVVAATGCMTVWRRLDVPAHADLASSNETAVISGSQSGLNGLECYVGEPARAREVTVDAGEQSIVAACYSWGGEGGTSLRMRSARLAFEALPDHAYELVGYSTCLACGKRSDLGYEHVDLVDRTDGDRVVVRLRLSRSRRPGG